jgi:hypothetical protein
MDTETPEKTRCTRNSFTHGTASMYTNGKCRCSACTDEHSSKKMSEKARRAALPKDPNDPRHGSVGFYTNWGCRCDACKAANTADHAARRAGKASR